MTKTYSIVDLNGFAECMRKSVADSFSDNYSENLDDFITINQVISVIAENSYDIDEDDNFVIDDNIFDIIFDSIRVWIYEVALAKLAANGSIECSWNNDTNMFEFWLPEKQKQ